MMKPMMKMGGNESYGDKGGAKMEGGMGAGVEGAEAHDAAKEGYDCLAKFPLTGEFWTREPEHGQA